MTKADLVEKVTRKSLALPVPHFKKGLCAVVDSFLTRSKQR